MPTPAPKERQTRSKIIDPDLVEFLLIVSRLRLCSMKLLRGVRDHLHEDLLLLLKFANFGDLIDYGHGAGGAGADRPDRG
jgi:hypothetical protein